MGDLGGRARERDRRVVAVKPRRSHRCGQRLHAHPPAGPARGAVRRRPLVDGRRGVRADSHAGLRGAARDRIVPMRCGDRRAWHVGLRDGNAQPGALGGRHHGRGRHPARDPRSTERRLRTGIEAGPRRDADDARVRVPRAGALPRRTRSRARDHRIVRVCPAGGDPAHEPRDPPGAEGDRRGGKGVRIDVVAAPAQGHAAARQTLDPAGREPDDHDGAVGGDHRRSHRRRRPRSGGRVRPREAADRSRRCGRGQHLAPRDRSRPYNSGDGGRAEIDARTSGDRPWVVDAHPRARGAQAERVGGRKGGHMSGRPWMWTVALAAVLALAMAACSDVEEGGTGDTGGGSSQVAKCGSEPLVIAVNPWVGAEANANVAKVVMEKEMGCSVELQKVNESAQFPAMADGDVDATLEVWPSGHAKDREDYIEKAGAVVDGGELGIVGNIGWFMPSYVTEDNPEYATWEGFKENADIFATAETGDKGRFLGADTTYSIFDEAIIASLGLDLEVVYSGSEAASLAALDKAVANQEPIIMYWWTPQWANAKYDLVEVELPAFDEECAQIALEDPDVAAGYDCDYAEDVLYKAFGAQLESKDPAAFAFLSAFNWTAEDQNSVALAIQEGADPEDAAQEWIDANGDVWSAWLPTEA